MQVPPNTPAGNQLSKADDQRSFPIVVQDQTFYVSRDQLCALSPVIRSRLLEPNYEPVNDGQLILNEETSHDVQSFLAWITPTTTPPPMDLSALDGALAIGKKYAVHSLRPAIIDALLAKIYEMPTPCTDAVEYLILASKHRLLSIQEILIHKCAIELTTSEIVPAIPRLPPNVIAAIMYVKEANTPAYCQFRFGEPVDRCPNNHAYSCNLVCEICRTESCLYCTLALNQGKRQCSATKSRVTKTIEKVKSLLLEN